MKATIQTMILDESNIKHLVHNAKLSMTSAAPHEFQQIIGPFSDSYFTEPECRLVHRHLVENNILCVRVDSTVKNHTLRTLILAHNEEAIQKALRVARKEINRLKGSIHIIRDLGEYERNDND